MISNLLLVLSAHPGRPHDLAELVRSWSFEPVVVVPLALSAWLYARGLRRLWAESGTGRGIHRSEAWAYAAGWATLVVALVSPMHPWSRVLFSVHMGQHELLMLVAAPLIVLGRPLVPYLWALPVGWRRAAGALAHRAWWQRAWRTLTHPLVATLVHAAAVWIWHIPALFDAVVDNEWIHAFQHVCFLGTAMLFWWALVHGRRSGLVYGAAVFYVFMTSAHSGLLGATLTLARSALYPSYRSPDGSWGMTPLEDQQLAGLLMWVPAGLVYLVAGLALFAGWLRESERRVERRELAEEAKRALCVAGPLVAAVALLGLTSCDATTLAARGPLAYVSCEREGTVAVVDCASDRVVATFEVGLRPRSIHLSADGRRLFVALTTPMGLPPRDADNKVLALDSNTGELLATYGLDGEIEQFGVSPDGRWLYVAMEEAGTVAFCDLETGDVEDAVAAGIETEGVAVSPDGRWLYVSSESSSTVSAVDTSTRSLVASVLVGSRPRGIAFAPDGSRAYVTAEVGNTLSVVDTASHRVVATVAMPTGSKPMGVAVSADGTRIYVGNGRGNTVSVLDAASLSIVETVPVGPRAWGVAVTPDGDKVYVCDSLSSTVTVVDARTNRVGVRVRVGDGPWGVAIRP